MSQLGEFLVGAGDRPYRDLIEYHMKRQSTEQLRKAGMGEIQMLPVKLKEHAIQYMDVVNETIGYSQDFWKTASCRDAFETIIEIALDVFPLDGQLNSVDDALRPKNHVLAFQLFQIPTLSIAYSASTQRKQRKFMGIRKGLFG